MENSRLVRLLRRFEIEELAELEDFTASPYFNKRREAPALLALLMKPLKSGKPVPEKEAVYQKLFGEGPFDDHRVRMAMSFLYNLAEEYLTIKTLRNDGVLMQYRQSVALRQKGLAEPAQKELNEALHLHEEKPLRNADFWEKRYELLLEQYRRRFDAPRFQTEELQGLSEALDTAFLARKFWQCCFMLSHRARNSSDLDFGLLDASLDFVEEHPGFLAVPAVSVYYHCFLALKSPSEKEHFNRFKSALFRSEALFPAEELRDLYVLAINFCIRRYNAGDTEYLPGQFELYKAGFERGYFLSEGILSAYTYQNAATIGLIMNELDWTAGFVEGYRQYLKPEIRESLFAFNLARLAYRKKQPGEALGLLQRAEYKDLMLHLAAKTLQMKIYYELSEYDLLESHLNAFRIFLNRKKMMGYHRDNYLKTLHFIQKILELSPVDKSARALLAEEIAQTGGVAEKEWLSGLLT